MQTPTKKKRKAASIVGNIVFYVLIVALIFGAFLIRSSQNGKPFMVGGYSAMTVLTGSMQDVYPQGALIITKSTDTNIRLKGSLIVRKSVENEDGSPLTEEQKNTAFKFSITFSGNGNRYDHYEYSIDGGEKKIFSSGDSFWLSDGQAAIFDELPAGILYSVA